MRLSFRVSWTSSQTELLRLVHRPLWLGGFWYHNVTLLDPVGLTKSMFQFIRPYEAYHPHSVTIRTKDREATVIVTRIQQ